MNTKITIVFSILSFCHYVTIGADETDCYKKHVTHYARLCATTLKVGGSIAVGGSIQAPGVVVSNGVSGAQGNSGVGQTGLTGATGATGTTGITGNTGDTGAAGAFGALGQTGNTGTTGLTGFTGPQGIAGNRGNVGPTGNTGNTGITGVSGVALAGISYGNYVYVATGAILVLQNGEAYPLSIATTATPGITLDAATRTLTIANPGVYKINMVVGGLQTVVGLSINGVVNDATLFAAEPVGSQQCIFGEMILPITIPNTTIQIITFTNNISTVLQTTGGPFPSPSVPVSITIQQIL